MDLNGKVGRDTTRALVGREKREEGGGREGVRHGVRVCAASSESGFIIQYESVSTVGELLEDGQCTHPLNTKYYKQVESWCELCRRPSSLMEVVHQSSVDSFLDRLIEKDRPGHGSRMKELCAFQSRPQKEIWAK